MQQSETQSNINKRNTAYEQQLKVRLDITSTLTFDLATKSSRNNLLNLLNNNILLHYLKCTVEAVFNLISSHALCTVAVY
uniref:Uncharacterized protein n=1 Tax=Glossina pallidipes TaxID=7398 RepID=A0A1B0A5D5_GLOPL